jgi:hypothetical protein
VTGPYAIAIIAVALALAVWAGLLVALDRPPGPALFVGAGVLEAMLVGFAVGGIVQMLQTDHTFSKGEFVLYLLACVAIPPIAFLWGIGEKARAGTAVLALAFLITPVMVIRVQQVWAG